MPIPTNPAPATSPTLDACVEDLSRLMSAAFPLLRQCELKLREFKQQASGAATGNGVVLGLEIAALLASTAEVYRLASKQARCVRHTLEAVVAEATRDAGSEADRHVILSVCRQTTEGLQAFEILIAEYGRQMDSHLRVFSQASLASDFPPEVSTTFRELLRKVMKV